MCSNCGDIDHLAENELCEKVPTCNNCKENNLPSTDHSAVCKICPIFIKEIELQAIKTLDKVDHKTAITKYNDRHSNIISYSSVARPQIVYDLPNQTAKTSEAKSTNKNSVLNSTNKDKQQESTTNNKTNNTTSPTKAEKIKILPISTSRRTRSQLKRAAKKLKTTNEKESQESEGTDNTTMDE